MLSGVLYPPTRGATGKATSGVPHSRADAQAYPPAHRTSLYAAHASNQHFHFVPHHTERSWRTAVQALHTGGCRKQCEQAVAIWLLSCQK